MQRNITHAGGHVAEVSLCGALIGGLRPELKDRIASVRLAAPERTTTLPALTALLNQVEGTVEREQRAQNERSAAALAASSSAGPGWVGHGSGASYAQPPGPARAGHTDDAYYGDVQADMAFAAASASGRGGEAHPV